MTDQVAHDLEDCTVIHILGKGDVVPVPQLAGLKEKDKVVNDRAVSALEAIEIDQVICSLGKYVPALLQNPIDRNLRKHQLPEAQLTLGRLFDDMAITYNVQDGKTAKGGSYSNSKDAAVPLDTIDQSLLLESLKQFSASLT